MAGFIEEHREAIEDRREALLSGDAKDPYLLVLAFERDVTGFLRDQGNRLVDLIDEWRLEEAGPGEEYFLVRNYYRHHRAPFENFTLRKVLYFEGVDSDVATEAVSEAMESGTCLVEIEHPSIASAHEKCAAVAELLEDEELDYASTAVALQSLVEIHDVARLEADLEKFPVNRTPLDHEEEEIETAGHTSPVRLMTMTGAKGLSADHVIILGTDVTNMARAKPELFFVALTRARQSLHLLIPLGGRGAAAAHQFVLELPEENCDYLKYKTDGATAFSGREPFLIYMSRIRTARRSH